MSLNECPHLPESGARWRCDCRSGRRCKRRPRRPPWDHRGDGQRGHRRRRLALDLLDVDGEADVGVLAVGVEEERLHVPHPQLTDPGEHAAVPIV